MPRIRNHPRRSLLAGYTLVEILVVIAIIALLLGLLVPVLSSAYTKSKTNTTRAQLSRLGVIFKSALGRAGTFPLNPSGNPDITSATPGYFTSPCAPEGSTSLMTESSKDLMQFLRGDGFPQPLSELHEGHMIDAFGNRIVFRFLRIPRDRANADAGLIEVAVMWSYGPDRKNDVKASPSYTYQPGPDYDLDEYERIKADDFGDDIVEILYN